MTALRHPSTDPRYRQTFELLNRASAEGSWGFSDFEPEKGTLTVRVEFRGYVDHPERGRLLTQRIRGELLADGELRDFWFQYVETDGREHQVQLLDLTDIEKALRTHRAPGQVWPSRRPFVSEG